MTVFFFTIYKDDNEAKEKLDEMPTDAMKKAVKFAEEPTVTDETPFTKSSLIGIKVSAFSRVIYSHLKQYTA